METNSGKEYRCYKRAARVGALITSTIFITARYVIIVINTRSFESAKNCSLRDARVTVDAIKITLLVHRTFCPDALPRGSHSFTRHRDFFFFFFLIRHACVIPIPFVRTRKSTA